MDAHFVDLPGVRLRYLDSGGVGTPVVFLHANTGTADSWLAQLTYFADAGYRAIAFDRRGWGQSTADPATGTSPGTIADDLDALATHLALAPFHLVGVAGGTFAAMDYAAGRPDQIRTMVAAASTGSIVDAEIADFTARILIRTLLPPSPAELVEVSAGYRGSDPTGTARWVAIEAASRQAGSDFQPLRSPNTYAKLATITAPVLALAGSADLIAPPALMRLWAAHLSDVEFATIVGAGHAIAWEQPDAFNERVHDFLRRHDP